MEPKQSSFLVILLSSLLIISCLIAGFFAYQTQKLVVEITGYRQQIKQTPTPTTTPDPTADWKTYLNAKYGYSFSYPNNLELEEVNGKVIVRIDPPDITAIVGKCPRYISFSAIDNSSVSKTSEDKYSCIYESIIINKMFLVESQYFKNENNIRNQILSTFKLTNEVQIACTMEAKLCPDGSAVGRSGPKCEFAPCPTPEP